MRCALLAQWLGVSARLVAHEPERQLSGAREFSESVSTPSTAAAPWSVLRGLEASAFQLPLRSHARRSARAPRVRAYDAAGDAEDYFKNARAGLELEKNEKGATEGDGVDDVVGPVRIEYPEDLHEAAKSDRRGPFWSSLGEPDVTTGPRPSYMRRDDWHISSTYTPEERAQVLKEEQEEVERVTEQVFVDKSMQDVSDDIFEP